MLALALVYYTMSPRANTCDIPSPNTWSAQAWPQAVRVDVREKQGAAAAAKDAAAAAGFSCVLVYMPSAHAVRAVPADGTDGGALQILVENDSSATGAYRCRTYCSDSKLIN